MTREAAILHVTSHFDSGEFFTTLGSRIALRTESQEVSAAPVLRAYLTDEIGRDLDAMGFAWEIVENPVSGMPPFIVAERIEGQHLPTVLLYGHGDVVNGQVNAWSNGRSPWTLTVEGDAWYGRGTADNKAQHSINLAALHAVLKTRGEFGFNAKLILEMGEEVGSPGLAELCSMLRDRLSADLFLASDGPRQRADAPTIFLGSRGALHFRLQIANDFGARHSGNWGGAIENPATVLANAIASLVDGRGRIRVNGLLPPPIPQRVRDLIAELEIGGEPGDPPLAAQWGEPGLTAAERVYAWNTMEILAMQSGDVKRPVSAIPQHAEAVCQLRFVVGTEWERAQERLEAHLEREGFGQVKVSIEASGAATRVDPDHRAVGWVAQSIEQTTGKRATILPNLGGTIPNECFASTLGLPTLWIPHSYPGCRQHGPDEHILASVTREALQVMTGLFWDLGAKDERSFSLA